MRFQFIKTKRAGFTVMLKIMERPLRSENNLDQGTHTKYNNNIRSNQHGNDIG